MKWRILFFLWVATFASAADWKADPPLILVSLDGFRWDYCELYAAESPTLRQLRKEGTTSRGLVPVFPSNTFPNHYSIVTGLYPAHHGIINNDFFDPRSGRFFHFNQPITADADWWGGEPIWVTAIKQGRKAATSFWVGSDSEIKGVRPTFWGKYNAGFTFEKRLEDVIGWMKLPPGERPAFVAIYLEETNGEGHRYGPESPQVAAAVKLCDDRLATLLTRLRGEGITPNLIVVSDHGMVATSGQRVVIVDDILDLKTVQIETSGSALALRPLVGDAAALVERFRDVAHVKAFLAEDLPPRFHLSGNPRISPVWVLPDEGWHLGTRAAFERLRDRYPATGYLGGDHGYDPRLKTMRGIFIAHGPAFARGVNLPEVENIHVYNLMCAVLNLKPAANDGDDRLVRGALRK